MMNDCEGKNMLLRFTISNFLSIREPQELSLIAGPLSDEAGDVIRDPEIPHEVLRLASIFGPNASGKSNMILGLRYIRSAVKNSQTKWEPGEGTNRRPFLLDDSKESPSQFSVDFLLKGVRYEYGFSVNDRIVLHEYLFAYPAGRRQRWFERNSQSEQIYFGKNLTGENRSIESLTRPDSLFLSAAAQNNHEKLRPVYDWFSTQLVFHSGVQDRAHYQVMEMCSRSAETREKVLRYLRAADLGIVDIEVREEEVPAEQSVFSKKLAALIKEVDPTASLDLSDTRKRLSLLHHAGSHRSARIDLGDESAGTLAYLAILGPIIEVLSNGGVLLVDELDASLHPLLVAEIVKLFNSALRNPLGAQLIFNAHSTELLSRQLRRDQIWLTEKDKTGATKLYPLTHYQPRKGENIQKSYLHGRYGATPYVHLSKTEDDRDGLD